jgi:hypothetical protein
MGLQTSDAVGKRKENETRHLNIPEYFLFTRKDLKYIAKNIDRILENRELVLKSAHTCKLLADYSFYFGDTLQTILITIELILIC